MKIQLTQHDLKTLEEVWVDLPNYEGRYKISNLGNVKTITYGRDRLLSQWISNTGYYCVKLSKNGGSRNPQVHQLVAIAFLNHKPDGHKMVIDHIDDNKLNNNVDNLRIVTQRVNVGKDRGSISGLVGVSWHKKSKKWRVRMQINGREVSLGLFDCKYEAAKAYQDKLKQLK